MGQAGRQSPGPSQQSSRMSLALPPTMATAPSWQARACAAAVALFLVDANDFSERVALRRRANHLLSAQNQRRIAAFARDPSIAYHGRFKDMESLLVPAQFGKRRPKPIPAGTKIRSCVPFLKRESRWPQAISNHTESLPRQSRERRAFARYQQYGQGENPCACTNSTATREPLVIPAPEQTELLWKMLPLELPFRSM